jgi:hypothetical protein
MKKQLILKLYRNTRGAVIGDLYQDGRRLLATTHPATIAAAIFAMDEYDFVFESKKGSGQFEFPIAFSELGEIASLLEDQDEGDFISGFATFSRFDFAHPHQFDNQAEIHHRVAIHHLGPELVKVGPISPTRKGFKKELRNRNKYVYFPYC